MNLHTADIQEGDGAAPLILDVLEAVPTLLRTYADGGYSGPKLGTVRRPSGQEGITALPKRWIVERTLAWLGRFRRLSKDCESAVASSLAWTQLGGVPMHGAPNCQRQGQARREQCSGVSVHETGKRDF
ncbi:MAG: hypothetical protein OXB95_10205 [Rhodobacteraceae bacterium]|nr:hypothetical protein [Paracoccaceae bacterium]